MRNGPYHDLQKWAIRYLAAIRNLVANILEAERPTQEVILSYDPGLAPHWPHVLSFVQICGKFKLQTLHPMQTHVMLDISEQITRFARYIKDIWATPGHDPQRKEIASWLKKMLFAN